MTGNIFSTGGRVANDNAFVTETLPRSRHTTSPLFTECLWINGELVPAEDVAVRDRPGFFEEIRCYPTNRGPAIFRLEAHLRHFLQTANALGVGDLRYDLVDLRRAVHVTVHVNNLSACSVRPILYMDREPGVQQTADYYPTVAVVTGGWQSASNGVRLMVSKLDSEHRRQGLTRQELQERAARTAQIRTAAQRAGFDEAILLNNAGEVVDCTGENLFLVRDGVVYTSPSSGALHDVARHTALTLLHDLGYPVVEERLSREHLDRAGEAFLCGTSSEIVPVRQIDTRTLNDGQTGTLTRTLRRLYADTTIGQGRRSRGWLEYVMMEPLF